MSSLSTDIGGRTALVSGSTQGIGRAIAAGLAAEGVEDFVRELVGDALRVDGGFVDSIVL